MKYIQDHVGRYTWVYIMAPLMGGVIGGYLAKVFEDKQSSDGPP